jgi:hypothetical protein
MNSVKIVVFVFALLISSTHAFEVDVQLRREVVKEFSSYETPIQIVQFTLMAKHREVDYVIWKKQQIQAPTAAKAIDTSIILVGSENINEKLFVFYVENGSLQLDLFSIQGMNFYLMDTERIGSGMDFLGKGPFEVKVNQIGEKKYNISLSGAGIDKRNYIYLPEVKKITTR